MIYFKKLNDQATLPTRATCGSAGFDLHYSGLPCVLHAGEYGVFETGIALEMGALMTGIIKPRSGMAVKYGIDVLAGVIDSDYRGEIKVILINHGKDDVRFSTGDRIAQIVCTHYVGQSQEIQTLIDTPRGENGFGSTGY